jgi:hypothetical protein
LVPPATGSSNFDRTPLPLFRRRSTYVARPVWKNGKIKREKRNEKREERREKREETKEKREKRKERKEKREKREKRKEARGKRII